MTQLTEILKCPECGNQNPLGRNLLEALRDEHVSVKDAGEALGGKSPEAVRKMCRDGELAYRRPGRSYLILAKSVVAYLHCQPILGRDMEATA